MFRYPTIHYGTGFEHVIFLYYADNYSTLDVLTANFAYAVYFCLTVQFFCFCLCLSV